MVLLISLMIGILALALRYDVSARMAVGGHPDEEIIGILAAESVRTGSLTANWEGFDRWWSRPTYQFSPYTLMQQSLSIIADRLGLLENTILNQIYFARHVNNVLGALTVIVVFWSAYELSASIFASTLAGLVLCVGFLHVQDTSYARVEALLSLLVAITIYSLIRARKQNSCLRWSLVAGFIAGIALATKYNSVPLLAATFVATAYSAEQGPTSSFLRLKRLSLIAGVIGLGFLFGTPQILANPNPMVEGLQYEANHYSSGHVPHQAFDFWDNNVFYLVTYMSCLGLGYVPCLLVLLFFFESLKPSYQRYRLIAFYLAIAIGLALLPKVRFERNYEVFYCVAAIATGLAGRNLIRYFGSDWKRRTVFLAQILLTIAIVTQSAVAISRFRSIISASVSPYLLTDSILLANPNQSIYYSMHDGLPDEPVLPYVVILAGFGDHFSEAHEEAWLARYAEYTKKRIQSPWRLSGYPFSTVDVYHGPTKIIICKSPR